MRSTAALAAAAALVACSGCFWAERWSHPAHVAAYGVDVGIAGLGVLALARGAERTDAAGRNVGLFGGLGLILLAAIGAATDHELGEPAPHPDRAEVSRSMHASFVADRGRYAELVVTRPDLAACLR